MLVWMCSAHVNQRSSKNCIIPLGVGAARGDYSGLGFLTQTTSEGTRHRRSAFLLQRCFLLKVKHLGNTVVAPRRSPRILYFCHLSYLMNIITSKSGNH